VVDSNPKAPALHVTSEVLPPLYDRWMAELLPGAIPRESRATCDTCAMVAPDGEQTGLRNHYFSPAIKCCSYVPTLHNFLVGKILADHDPATKLGRATVEKRITDRVAVTPLGLLKSPIFKLLYEEASASSFGRNRTLVCPHYLDDGGRCGVWPYRESTCVTWFCKHVRGEVGLNFWRRSLQKLLAAIEDELSAWCVLEMNVGDDTLRNLFSGTPRGREASDSLTSESLENRVDGDSYGRLWGTWLGREAEFYLACGRLVAELSWSDVLAISGPEVRVLSQLTLQAYEQLLSAEVAPALEVGSMQLVQITRDTARVTTYSEIDPLDLPRSMFEFLHYFDGRPTADALSAIESEQGVRLDPALVRKMMDFSLLITPEESGQTD